MMEGSLNTLLEALIAVDAVALVVDDVAMAFADGTV